MSIIKSELFRSSNNRMIKVSLSLEYGKNFDYATLAFQSDGSRIAILSTSTGSIDTHDNLEIKGKTAEIYLEYTNSSMNIECLIGYYENKELKYYETLKINAESNKEIEKSQLHISTIKTMHGSFKYKVDSFLESLNKRQSLWKMSISSKEDISVNVLNSGDSSIMISFGEESKDIMVSDYIFEAFSKIETFIIPREILKTQYPLYQPHCRLGIYELVKPDFIKNKNIYYKTLISNTIPLHEFAK